MFYLELTHYSNSGAKSCFYIKNKDTGVGNMLFQIASATAFSIKNKIPVYIIGLNTFLRLEELKKENTIFRYINIKEYTINISKTIDLSTRYRDIIYDYLTYSNNMCVISYFENYKNFDEYRDIILAKFSPIKEDKDYLINKYPFILNDDTTSLHIRCGPIYRRNYKITNENINNNELTLLYHKGLDKMLKIKNINYVLLCTDDVEYCIEILCKNEKYKNIKFIFSDERDYVDVWLMSLIKNNIVSFSTLSWWGSYLNSNQNKTVICCKEFRKDIHYPGWIII
jgi:hypothetical protein